MYRSGITVLDAMRNSEDIVGNRVIADGLRRATQQIAAGDSLTESFHNLGLFPPLVIRMLRVGEAPARSMWPSCQRQLLLQPRRTRIRGQGDESASSRP
jgi:hypothetical protein